MTVTNQRGLSWVECAAPANHAGRLRLLRLGRKSQDRPRLKRKFRKKPATVRAPLNSVTVTKLAVLGVSVKRMYAGQHGQAPDNKSGQRFRTNWFTDSLMDKPHPGQSRAPAGAALLARWCIAIAYGQTWHHGPITGLCGAVRCVMWWHRSARRATIPKRA